MPEHDILVIGGGIAGLRAAVEARRSGLDVVLLAKTHPLRSHSCTYQAGVTAALAPDDSWEQHAQDTVRGSDYLADQDIVEGLCREAPERVLELDRMGAPFTRDATGHLAWRRLSGSLRPRACYAADITGHVILQTLYEQALKEQITTYSEWFATSLLMVDGICRGAIALEMKTGDLQLFQARAVILATGSAGQLYSPTTASLGCTGDGVALAYRAGARLMDMEMLQYQPTALQEKGVLVTEALLSEGAVLVNKSNERFLEGSAPEAKELAPRDVVARAIEKEVREGRGQDGAVLLDARPLGEKLASFSHTRWSVKALTGVDLSQSPVPVRPAMHRPMGGIQTDQEGTTSVSGLYAVGECACPGVHGANRLGGNSLLEAVVLGARTGGAAVSYTRGIGSSRAAVPGSQSQLQDEAQRLGQDLPSRSGNDSARKIRLDLRELMHTNVGLERDGQGLTDAGQRVEELKARFQRVGAQQESKAYNFDLLSYLELGSLLEVAKVVVASALARTESRGAHFRRDFPQRDDAQWLKHILITSSPDGPTLDFKPVVITRWQPGERIY